MNKVVGACGCICSDCHIFEVKCMGCHAIEGKECEEIPCEKFWMNKNPNWTDEQHKKLLKIEPLCLKSWQTLGIIKEYQIGGIINV